jgi:hypothetical protein
MNPHWSKPALGTSVCSRGLLLLVALVGSSPVVANPPDAMLFAPQQDSKRPGVLIMRWDAKPQFRGATISSTSLHWAESANGPWHRISDPTKRTGDRCTWQVSAMVPDKVYLRLTVRDSIGHIAVAQTEKPCPIRWK